MRYWEKYLCTHDHEYMNWISYDFGCIVLYGFLSSTMQYAQKWNVHSHHAQGVLYSHSIENDNWTCVWAYERVHMHMLYHFASGNNYCPIALSFPAAAYRLRLRTTLCNIYNKDDDIRMISIVSDMRSHGKLLDKKQEFGKKSKS